MGILAEAWNPRAQANVPAYGSDPLNSFWYTRDPSGFLLETAPGGITLSADTILKCGTVFAAVGFRGDSWAMCPPTTYRKTSKGRKEEPGHYSQIVLRNPAPWITGNRWRHLNGVWMAMWGNAYNEMIAGPRSFADQLRPLHPSRVRVVDQRSDGTLLYEYDEPGAEKRTLGQERVLHFRDLSTDGMSGVPMYRLIRNVVTIALLAERHQMTFLAKGARLSGLLVPTLPLDKDQRKVLKESVNEDLGGAAHTGTFGIMPHGVDLKTISNTNREAQFAELDDHTVGSILRFLRVPGVVVGWADKTATYASAEAFFEKGGIKHCVLPMLVNVEAEEEKALLPEGSGLQIKHNLDALERANLRDRTEALVRSIGGPFRTVNEGRTIEDLERLDDPRYDEVLTPANMDPDPEPEPEPELPPMVPPVDGDDPDDPDEEDEDARENAQLAQRTMAARGGRNMRGVAEQLAQGAAAQAVRREVAAIRDKAPKLARNPAAWRAWVEGYYDRHAGHLARALNVDADRAREYCDRQTAALLAEGVAVAQTWERENVPRLVALVLGEGA